MISFLKTCGRGCIVIISSPLWLLFFAMYIVYGLFLFIYMVIKAIVKLFTKEHLSLETEYDRKAKIILSNPSFDFRYGTTNAQDIYPRQQNIYQQPFAQAPYPPQPQMQPNFNQQQYNQPNYNQYNNGQNNYQNMNQFTQNNNQNFNNNIDNNVMQPNQGQAPQNQQYFNNNQQINQNNGYNNYYNPNNNERNE